MLGRLAVLGGATLPPVVTVRDPGDEGSASIPASLRSKELEEPTQEALKGQAITFIYIPVVRLT